MHACACVLVDVCLRVDCTDSANACQERYKGLQMMVIPQLVGLSRGVVKCSFLIHISSFFVWWRSFTVPGTKVAPSP